MSLVEKIVNGQIADTSRAEAAERNKIGDKGVSETSNSSFDKEMFLKLLAAEMQYQDPMSPTDNSQYVSEMATFSQVEATTNVSDTVSKMNANALIGNYVTVNTDDGDITGVVDYVTKRSDGTKLSINNKEYDIDDVKTVTDSNYYEAGLAANALNAMIAKLPSLENLTKDNAQDVANCKTVYDAMSQYTKGFVPAASVSKLNSLVQRMNIINNSSEKADN